MHYLKVFDARKARKMVALVSGTIILIGTDNIIISKECIDLLGRKYRNEGVNFHENLKNGNILLEFDLVDYSNHDITALGKLYHEHLQLNGERKFTNLMIKYLKFFKEKCDEVQYRVSLDDILDDNHPLEEMIEMGKFLKELGYIDATFSQVPRVLDIITIKSPALVLLNKYEQDKEWEKSLSILENNDREMILKRKSCSELLVKYGYYSEGFTCIGSILEYLMYLKAKEINRKGDLPDKIGSRLGSIDTLKRLFYFDRDGKENENPITMDSPYAIYLLNNYEKEIINLIFNYRDTIHLRHLRGEGLKTTEKMYLQLDEHFIPLYNKFLQKLP
jgi:hypothetical protein